MGVLYNDNGELREIGGKPTCGVYNTREILTVSGTYTAKVTGWHKVTCIGGGGGGALSSVGMSTGGSGASGGKTEQYKFLEKGNFYPYVIGAGGAKGTSSSRNGKKGGDTMFNNDPTTKGGGGYGGSNYSVEERSLGGTSESGTPGFSGNAPIHDPTSTRGVMAVNGAGPGGADSNYGGASAGNPYANSGGGGAGSGKGATSEIDNATNGAAGVIFIEYFDPDKPTA